MQLKPVFSIATLFLLGCTTLPNPSMQAKGYIKKLNLEYVFYFENKYSKENQELLVNLKEMEEYEKQGYNLIYWKLKLINIQQVKFDKNKWNKEITNKINNFYEIYKEEKIKNNPVNQFINEDD